MGHNTEMSVEAKLRTSAIYCACFLAAAIIVPIILNILHVVSPVSNVSAFILSAIWSLILASFFVTLSLAMRGYVYLGDKYDIRRLRTVWYIYTFAMASLCILIMASVALSARGSTGIALDIVHALIGFAVLPYSMMPFVLGASVLKLQPQLRLVVLPFGVGTVLLVYAFYGFAGNLLPTDLPQFLGVYVWVPVTEALFAIASAALFLQASSR